MAEPRPIQILLVEDNPGDVRLTQEALKEAKIKNTVHVVSDGFEAFDFVTGRSRPEGTSQPDLILLDLNLPGYDGREVLKDIKEDPHSKHIPVVVLTSSEAEADILKSYRLHANSYITKPVDLDQFVRVIKSIEEFWFSLVKLPPK